MQNWTELYSKITWPTIITITCIVDLYDFLFHFPIHTSVKENDSQQLRSTLLYLLIISIIGFSGAYCK